ncbi:MAG: signal peptidase I [Alphaproteobacteria bacterium]|nr:signal peptidase I [Alphaproteobacteria bacterium]
MSALVRRFRKSFTQRISRLVLGGKWVGDRVVRPMSASLDTTEGEDPRSTLPKQTSRRVYWIFSLCFLFCWLVVSQTRLRECLSDSLDGINYVLFLKSSSIQRGDIVSIQGHCEDHVGTLPKWPYAKWVLGIPGDRIIQNRDGITVIPKENGPLTLLTKTSKGKPLNSITENIIPEGFLFVAGDNPQSFDSRYDEFGLVPVGKVWGKAILKW